MGGVGDAYAGAAPPMLHKASACIARPDCHSAEFERHVGEWMAVIRAAPEKSDAHSAVNSRICHVRQRRPHTPTENSRRGMPGRLESVKPARPYLRRDEPPRIEPSTPRTISRPICVPMARAALFAAAATTESPPRLAGFPPPPKIPPRPSSQPPLEAGA